MIWLFSQSIGLQKSRKFFHCHQHHTWGEWAGRELHVKFGRSTVADNVQDPPFT